MNILHVSFLDSGGAANAAFRIHEFLLDHEFSSRFMVAKVNRPRANSVVQFDGQQRKYTFFQKVLWKLGFPQTEEQKWMLKIDQYKGEFEILSSPITDYDIMSSTHYEWADIVHFHWVANYVDIPSFLERNKKPLVWTFHDLNPISGIIHYDHQWTRSQRKLELLNQDYMDLKNQCYRENLDLHVVAPSLWLRNRVVSVDIFPPENIHHIEYGVGNGFGYFDKVYARRKLGLEADRTIGLFLSESTSNYRKGFDLLLPVIEDSDLLNVNWMVVGNSKTADSDSRIKNFGFVQEAETLNLIYAAADFFVIPSRQDNLPNTVIESLSSGCPVIGFDVGGIPEMIDDGKNGYVVEDVSSKDLKVGIEEFLKMNELYDRQQISIDALERFGGSRTSSKYIELYGQLCR